MKTQLLNIALLSTLITAPAAFAEEGVGTHGGNGIVCFSDPAIAAELNVDGRPVAKTIPSKYLSKITSITTLDLVEAKNVIQLFPNETENEYVTRIAKRLNAWSNAIQVINLYINVDPWTGSSEFVNLIGDTESNFSEIVHIKDDSMIPSNDIEPIGKPIDPTEPNSKTSRCVYATIAKQTAYGFSSARRLAIDDRLYYHPKHSTLSRAVLMVHENVLVKLGARNPKTEAVRSVVANLISTDLTYAVLMKIIGKEHRASLPVTPSATYALAEDFRSFRRAYVDQLETLKKNVKTDFISNNIVLLPRKVRSVFEGSYLRDDISCQSYRNEFKWLYLSEETCATLNDMNERRKILLFSSEYNFKQKYAETNMARWKEVVYKSAANFTRLNLTSFQQKSLLQKAVDLNPFDLNQPFDFSQFNFDPSEVHF